MKKVTIKDIAKKAGVSTATVSRALSKGALVADETQFAIAKAAGELGYNRSSKALLRNEGKPGLIYFLMKSAQINPFARMLDFSIIQAAEKWNIKIVSASLNPEATKTGKPDPLTEAHIIMHIQEAMKLCVKGMIISGFEDKIMNKSISLLIQNCGIPIVFINRGFDSYSFTCVSSDASKGIYFATKYLLENGRKNLLMLALTWQMLRTRGFLRAIEEHSPEKPKHAVVEIHDDSIKNTYGETEKIFKKNPHIDGILCSSDELAAGVLRYLVHEGKKVPDDVELIGYNDNLAPMLTPPISSVQVPIKEIAESAIEMIVKEEAGTDPSLVKTVILEPRLIVRNWQNGPVL
ncbi:MAG: LacI family transcriptional regulator [Spirochaetia bacterium]|jgi:LacI family transcriptional regulator|nr:LacI family transcriptional regulator [Spirochaetia bacterium]